jgi:hypothetical protein
MSEIKREIRVNPDSSYTITDDHSIADIVRWLLTQESKETIMYLLGEESVPCAWVGLTDEEKFEVSDISDSFEDVVDAVEIKLKDKNT